MAAKLEANGALVWNTFLGGGSADDGNDIALDGAGNIYVVGTSWASWGAPLRAHTPCGPPPVCYDVYVAKLLQNLPGPTIVSVTSKQGKPGEPATINGTAFSATKTANTVKFGRYAATVTMATTSKLTVRIPTKCKSGRTYNVYVQVSGKKSNTVPLKLK